MKTSRPWSKLQRKLYNIVDDKINFQIHVSIYRMQNQYGHTNFPRYWVTVDGNIVFDYPKDFGVECFDNMDNLTQLNVSENSFFYYPYSDNGVNTISNLIEEYLNTERDALIEKSFKNDTFGITDILKAADKRIGKRRLEYLKDYVTNERAIDIIDYRLSL